MAAGEFNHLRHFCFRDLVCEHAAYTHTVAMDMEHDLHRLVPALVEELLQNMNDELHRRIVVVQDKHFVQAGSFGFRSRLRYDAGTGAVSGAVALPRSVVFLVAHALSTGTVGTR